MAEADIFASTRADRFADFERRLRELEFRFVRSSDASGDEFFERRLEAAERSIAWLEKKALRPEDRPTPPATDPVKEARAAQEAHEAARAKLRLEMRHGRDIDALDAWLRDVLEKVAETDAGNTLARQRLEAALKRLDVLEERCLKYSELPDPLLKPSLRGITRTTGLPIAAGGPIGRV